MFIIVHLAISQIIPHGIVFKNVQQDYSHKLSIKLVLNTVPLDTMLIVKLNFVKAYVTQKSIFLVIILLGDVFHDALKSQIIMLILIPKNALKLAQEDFSLINGQELVSLLLTVLILLLESLYLLVVFKLVRLLFLLSLIKIQVFAQQVVLLVYMLIIPQCFVFKNALVLLISMLTITLYSMEFAFYIVL